MLSCVYSFSMNTLSQILCEKSLWSVCCMETAGGANFFSCTGCEKRFQILHGLNSEKSGSIFLCAAKLNLLRSTGLFTFKPSKFLSSLYTHVKPVHELTVLCFDFEPKTVKSFLKISFTAVFFWTISPANKRISVASFISVAYFYVFLYTYAKPFFFFFELMHLLQSSQLGLICHP